MQHDDWTKQLRDRLANQQATPPDDLWQGIERALDDKRRRKRVVMLRLWTAAAAIAAVIAVGVGYYVDANREQRQLTADAAATPAANKHTADTGTPSLAQQATTLADKATTYVQRIMGGTAGRNTGNTLLASVYEQPTIDATNVETSGRDDAAPTSTTAENNGENVASRQPVGPANNGHKQGNRGDNTNQRHNYNRQQQYAYHDSRSTSSEGQWSVGAHATNVFGQRNTTNGVVMSRPMLASMASANALFAASNTAITDTHEEKKHYQPVTVGLTASYAINDRLSVTSGVTYTKASSDFTHVHGNASTTDKQSLHYIGVPVQASYDVWRTGNFKVYATAGGQADFNVKASVQTEGVKAKMKKDRPQLSVGAAAGAQYDVTPQVGVYAEPGVKYYFDNGSDVENVFKSRPCSFSLQVGVRINIK